MRGLRTQQLLKAKVTGLYETSGNNTNEKNQVWEPYDRGPYAELNFSIVSTSLVTSYFEEHLKQIIS